MRFINFLVLKLAGCLTLGIILAYHFPSSASLGIAILLVLSLLLVLLWFFEYKKLRQGPLFGPITFALFIALGYVNLQWSEPHYQPHHFSHSVVPDEPQIMEIRITEVLKPNKYQRRYFGNLLQLGDSPTLGKLLIKVPKDHYPKELRPDDHLFICTQIQGIPGNLNPNQFSYQTYLKQQGVSYQVHLLEGELLRNTQGRVHPQGLSHRIRNYISGKVRQLPLHKDAFAITQALVLGERRGIDRELYANYAAAGAVHLLAISGLHVGIFFLFLSWLLYPLAYIKHGTYLKSITIVLVLWLFAFVAGLSPSVVRAVTMFSCFALAQMLNRPTNGFNTLALSYFILLLVKPHWLFHVGFQLSYLAVFFILWLQPKIYGIYRPKWWVDKYLWGILSVTLAAQVGVAPLSIYYFHQFPGLFLLTNIIVLPFLGILLGVGICIAIWALLGSVPSALVYLYNEMIRLLNTFINWIATQEHFLLKDIPFSLAMMLCLYLLIFSLSLLWKESRKQYLFASLGAIVLLLGIHSWERSTLAGEQLIVFHSSKHSLMAYQKGRELKVFGQDSLNPAQAYTLKAYGLLRQTTHYQKADFPSIFRMKGKKVIRLDSWNSTLSMKADIVLLTESPKVNLERLIQDVQPELIIADGSNYKSYVTRWKATCKKRKLPFHYTGEMGAYIFE